MPWNYLRNRFRDKFLNLLARTFDSAEGQEILAQALPGLLATPPVIPQQSWIQSELEYPDLGKVGSTIESTQAEEVVFITSRFRSGSTLLWNLFRQLPNCTAYYEPLNERRWFDPHNRGSRVDDSHLNVRDYWQEYAGLEYLGECFDTRWNERQLYMDAKFSDPKLLRYLKALIDHATGRPVLQFNRMDFRLPWLRSHFPRAKIVHLVRHPRASWYSSLMGKEPCPREISIEGFAQFDELYLLHWMKDLGHHFPVLADPSLSHPYEVYYCIWKLSHAFGYHYADHRLTFESLVSQPEEEITALLSALKMDTTPAENLSQLIEPVKLDAWQNYADEEWFKSHEDHCNRLLITYYPSLVQSSELPRNLITSPL